MHGAVLDVERPTPHLVRVRLGGAGLAGFAVGAETDSYVNLQLVPAGAPYTVPFDADEVKALPREQQPVGRRYTVRAWDADAGVLTLELVVHGEGAVAGLAGAWAAAAQPGDLLALKGPGGGYAPDPDADAHLMVGDESALPAIAASLERVPSGVPVRVVAVVDGPEGHLELTSPGALEVTWVHRGGADDPQVLARAVAAVPRPGGRLQAFVHGEAEEVKAVRTLLLGPWAIERADLSASPYWRRGMTDEQWRAVKGAWTRALDAGPGA